MVGYCDKLASSFRQSEIVKTLFPIKLYVVNAKYFLLDMKLVFTRSMTEFLSCLVTEVFSLGHSFNLAPMFIALVELFVLDCIVTMQRCNAIKQLRRCTDYRQG